MIVVLEDAQIVQQRYEAQRKKRVDYETSASFLKNACKVSSKEVGGCIHFLDDFLFGNLIQCDVYKLLFPNFQSLMTIHRLQYIRLISVTSVGD